MASKLRVEELRSKLALRGLDTIGTKPMLVKRLEEAMRSEDEKEKKEGVDESAPSADDSFGGKRSCVESDAKPLLVKRLEEAMQSEDDGRLDESTDIKDNAGADEAVPPSNVVSNNGGKRKRSSVGHDLKVDELRSKLLLRGLDTSGTKPVLIKRLEEAIQGECETKNKAGVDETVPSLDEGVDVATPPSDDVSNHHGKRKRSSIEPDDGSKEVEYLDEGKLKKYPVRELKALAEQCGVSASGTKGELVKRLTGVAKIPKVTVQEEESESIKEEKLVIVIKKGIAVLDRWLPNDIKSSYHVLHKGKDIYDATLNLTDVEENYNKFFVIQVLEPDIGFEYMVYCRSGRVGVKGQDKLLGPFSEIDAIENFVSIFRKRTGNCWLLREKFVTCYKLYTWLEMDYMNDGQEQMGDQIQETKLDEHVAKFISLIYNISLMKQQVLEIGYNAEKLPLGKLSKSTILKGYDVLRRISDVVELDDWRVLEALSGEFYTMIPHVFGFKKIRDFVIDTPYKLKTKLEMVSALEEIEITTKILEDGNSLEDPWYSHYQNLNCELTPVQVNSNEFSMVEKYIKNSDAQKHLICMVDLVHLFRVSRKGEDERFKQFSNVKNRLLLWHGSRLSSWVGILSEGLKIDPPPEEPDYRFRKGVYFTDTFLEGANCCRSNPISPNNVLLLCEVALGDMHEVFKPIHIADPLPEGKLCTKGVGFTTPDMSESEILEDGLVVPLGKLKANDSLKTDFFINEYVVYNVDQIRMRYLVQVKFGYK